MPEINEEFAQSIRKDLTLEELTKEVEKAVMEETGTSKKDARNRQEDYHTIPYDRIVPYRFMPYCRRLEPPRRTSGTGKKITIPYRTI